MFKILQKKYFDKYDQKALYLWDKVFKDDAEYQKLRKKLRVKSIKPKLRPEFEKIRESLKKRNKNKKIWQELAKKCIECGQCVEACPTCFCFRFEYDSSGKKTRMQDSCFSHDFSEIAGSHKFLDSTAKRLFFWYYHKFVRIPDEYGLPGCVECGRCAKACPVGIDIKKVLREINSSSAKTRKPSRSLRKSK